MLSLRQFSNKDLKHIAETWNEKQAKIMISFKKEYGIESTMVFKNNIY